MFALAGLDEVPGSCNLKCDPDWAERLREQHDAIIPGYHMNKKHWNTVIWDGSVADQLILQLIDHSYHLVVAALPKARSKSLSGNKVINKKRGGKNTGSRIKKAT